MQAPTKVFLKTKILAFCVHPRLGILCPSKMENSSAHRIKNITIFTISIQTDSSVQSVYTSDANVASDQGQHCLLLIQQWLDT